MQKRLSKNLLAMAKKELKGLRGRLSFNVPMRRYTTMRTGGPALALYQPESIVDLIDCVKLCKENNISMLAIGCGSNIIINDKGVNKIFVKLSSQPFKKIEACQTELSCGAGVLLNDLCHFAEEHSLAGCEFLIGIPGTIGGAVIQNAGAHGSSVSDIIKDVKCLDRNGRLRIFEKKDIDFGYRESSLEDFIIIGATFNLSKGDRKIIRNNIKRYIEKRLSSQDYTAPNAGCVFKNPKGSKLSAGRLIESCGLKGKIIGGAAVSQRHANFIVNKKSATTDDIVRLAAFVKKTVRQKTGISLEEEVKIIT